MSYDACYDRNDSFSITTGLLSPQSVAMSVCLAQHFSFIYVVHNFFHRVAFSVYSNSVLGLSVELLKPRARKYGALYRMMVHITRLVE